MAPANCAEKTERFQCDICQKNFTRKFSIGEHMKVHIKNQKKLVCPECLKIEKIKSFSKRSNLVHHCRTCHSDCDLKNILENARTTPIPSATSKNRFKCYICGNSYKRKAHLKTHIADIHEEKEKPKCNECGREFRNIGGLRKHIRIQNHGKKSAEENSEKGSSSKQKTMPKEMTFGTAPTVLSIDDCNGDGTMFGNHIESVEHILDNGRDKDDQAKNAIHKTVGTFLEPVASTSGVQQLKSSKFETTKEKKNMKKSLSNTKRDETKSKRKNQMRDTELNDTRDYFDDTPCHASINECFQQMDQEPLLLEDDDDPRKIQTILAGKSPLNSSQKPTAAKSLLPMPPADYVFKQSDFQLPDEIFNVYVSGESLSRSLVQIHDYKAIHSNVYSDSMKRAMKSNRLSDSPVCSCKPEYECGDNCSNRLDYTECDQKTCPCGKNCKNSIISKNVTVPKCQRFMTTKKGWGVKACEPIQNGTFIMQYLGEVVTNREFMDRMRTTYKNHTNFYGIQLNADSVIDAHQRGNFSRLINHSCKSVGIIIIIIIFILCFWAYC